MMKWTYMAAALLLLVACGTDNDTDTRFKLLSAERTGVTFSNDLAASPDMNVFEYMYYFNGGGVAAGDLNGDGLPDLYFTANQGDNALYLNRGDLQFEDITEAADVAGMPGWTTGVTMADVNGDGRLDLYVSQLGEYLKVRGRNQLYINLGNDAEGRPIFEDQADRYGLALVGFSTQAAFFDYDLDGDLDLYMLNHSVHKNGTFGKRGEFRDSTHALAGDKLMRNDDNFFTEVTAEAGLYSSQLGYGLGISTGDVNLDGYPDIYIGNDFHENDYLYLNNGDGTFREALEESMMHTGRFSMGNDIADLNNDALPDIISTDMLPEDPEIWKASAAEDPFDIYDHKINFGYGYQYARNTLQLNRGDGTFSEVGLHAGVAATDWSWSAFFCDLDLDGHKDLFISNGIQRRQNDLDYINFVAHDSIKMQIHYDEIDQEDLALIENMPEIKLPNYAYRNNGNATFEDMSHAWGFRTPSYSNGATYADLDNDGDLDLITNNVADRAFIYENRTAQRGDAHGLVIELRGEGRNPYGIGSKVIVESDAGRQLYELYTTKGYQSSVEPIIIAGLGTDSIAQRVTVVWPDGRYQQLENVPSSNVLTLKQAEATNSNYNYADLRPTAQPALLEDVTNIYGLDYAHKENKFVEFNRERLLPHMMSTEGPAAAVGDVNGDNMPDIYLGGGKRQAGQLYLRTSAGDYELSPQPAIEADALNEDTDAAFADIDGDGDLDLIVASGGNEFEQGHPANEVRLYRNDGGTFVRDRDRIPTLSLTAAAVRVADYDGDGDTDVFVAARAVTSNYGQIPTSYLLRNEGSILKEVPNEDLAQAGLLTDARWADMTGDGKLDLVVVGEWMAPTVYEQREGGELVRMQTPDLADYKGWWRSLHITDLDGDGNLDIIAGNHGSNTKLHATPEEPMTMYYADFDDNETAEQVITFYIDGQPWLLPTRDELAEQMTVVKKNYLKYSDYAKATPEQVIGREPLREAEQYQVMELRSMIFYGRGGGSFMPSYLPGSAQYSTVEAIHTGDFNEDGRTDILTGGNFYATNIQLGRYDANYGTLLLAKSGGDFEEAERRMPPIRGEVRAILPVGSDLLIMRNNAPAMVLRKPKSLEMIGLR